MAKEAFYMKKYRAKSTGSALEKGVKAQTIEVVRSDETKYGAGVLKATETGNGNVVFSRPSGGKVVGSSKAPTQTISYKIKHGAVIKSNGETDFIGIDFGKVKTISGETNKLGKYLSGMGFKLDANSKMWTRGN